MEEGVFMKLALVGSSGYIAEFLFEKFLKDAKIESVLKIDRTPSSDVYLDLEEAEKFDYIQLDNVDKLIFTAAVSSPDKCAEDYDKCWNINVIGTTYFIKEAIRRGCRVLFFSSDAVFGERGKITQKIP